MVTDFVMDNLSLVEKRVAVRLCFTQGYQKEKRKKEKRKKEKRKVTHVFMYRHECEHFSFLLITVDCDAI
jgi:hypothetical protein